MANALAYLNYILWRLHLFTLSPFHFFTLYIASAPFYLFIFSLSYFSKN
ncbi:hypothetical protein HMPREF9151_02256 [Hoylesella saccharolytica F0055]|uniref:Uncharacterized protein n=1 Tax=Hoylesella saccharolytica F0055 TaxID=1127699 RepID=L1N1W3_9BACT|nr:hypothetical protein HMPREF9151_02256 [Hoylesella saccharolytica F0055]